MMCTLLLKVLCLVALEIPRSSSLSSYSGAAELNRAQLKNALSSPSGKLTLSPEIFIPEATTPTAILLQASVIAQLSERIRVEAKANAAFMSADSLQCIKRFCDEQESARGSFPGPVPVIYCQSTTSSSSNESGDFNFSEIASTGVSGVLVQVNEGSETSCIEAVEGESCRWLKLWKKSLEYGLQPVPEIRVKDSTAATWKEEEIEALYEKIKYLTGDDPVSILLTISSTTDKNDEEGETELKEEELPLPFVSKSIGKRVPIISSVRTSAGGNRIGEEASRLKSSGFIGALLRRECVPSYSNNPSLEYLSDFWVACISDLKSTRSKTFNFRSKNNMEKSVATQWSNYQSDVISSGALGEPDEPPPPGFDTDSGDYQGF